MASALTPSSVVAEARARLQAEGPVATRLRQEVRALWDSAEQLSASDAPPIPTGLARLALHRAALELALEQWTPGVAPGERVAKLSPEQHQVLAPDHPDVGSLFAAATHGDLELGWAMGAHRRLLAFLERDLQVVQRSVRTRAIAFGFAALIASAVAGLVVMLVVRVAEPRDLARGKTFSFSSQWAQCHPDQGECGGYPTKVFFHTTEEQSPWVLVDLVEPTAFTRVSVRNRSDMALMKAVPLIVEVGDDGKVFTEVARQRERFDTWTATFPPQKARYVRLRVDRFSTLHLEAVKVWP